MQVRTMILGEAMLSERLAAGAFEVQAGRVHEHQIELREQIAPVGEQLLFDDILQAARREGRAAILFLRGQFLAQPRHRPIEVMQVEPIDAVDRVVLPPAVRRTVGPAREQAMQNGEEHGTFEREPVLAFSGKFFDHGAAAGLVPQTLEHKGGPKAPHRCPIAVPSLAAFTTIALAENRAPERNNRSN